PVEEADLVHHPLDLPVYQFLPEQDPYINETVDIVLQTGRRIGILHHVGHTVRDLPGIVRVEGGQPVETGGEAFQEVFDFHGTCFREEHPLRVLPEGGLDGLCVREQLLVYLQFHTVGPRVDILIVDLQVVFNGHDFFINWDVLGQVLQKFRLPGTRCPAEHHVHLCVNAVLQEV